MKLTGCAKVWEHPGGRDVCEGEEGRPLPVLIERHFSTVHVQLDTDDLRPLGHFEGRPRGGAGLVLAIAQPYTPEALSRRQYVLALPIDGVLGHSNNPVCVIAHLHLPAVPARAEALGAQHLGADVKALGVVRQPELLCAALHPAQVLRDQEAVGGSVGIYDHRGWKAKP